MEITHTLSKAQADELFAAEAVFLYGLDVIPEYRVVELFGRELAPWLHDVCGVGRWLKAGRDYNEVGDPTPILRYFSKPGFYKIVSEVNRVLLLKFYRASEAGKLLDAACGTQPPKLVKLDFRNAEDAHKPRKRRAKRTTAETDEAQG